MSDGNLLALFGTETGNERIWHLMPGNLLQVMIWKPK